MTAQLALTVEPEVAGYYSCHAGAKSGEGCAYVRWWPSERAARDGVAASFERSRSRQTPSRPADRIDVDLVEAGPDRGQWSDFTQAERDRMLGEVRIVTAQQLTLDALGGDPDPARRHQQGPRGDRTYPHWQMSAVGHGRTITASGYFPDEARALSWIRLTIAWRYGDCDGVRFTVKPDRKATA